jgi:hypothetical protein
MIFVGGCTETQRTVQEANPAVRPVSPGPVISGPKTVISPSSDSIAYRCPRPQLKFNDSQEITRINSLDYSSPFEEPVSRPGLVPLGGVVYRSLGFTRIFDSSGIQILLVNDTDSVVGTPGGYQVAACVHRYIPDMKFVPEGENIQNIYIAGNDTCIVSIIDAGGSCFQPEIH